MRPFRYLRDPLFVCTCALYALNRWALKPHLHSQFLRSYFNDLLLIPCAIPVLLFVQRLVRLRTHDKHPTGAEVISCVVIWSLLFEWIGPRFMPGTTSDPLDTMAYGVGAIIAFVWWHRVRWGRAESAKV